jgi:hypothetical protein
MATTRSVLWAISTPKIPDTFLSAVRGNLRPGIELRQESLAEVTNIFDLIEEVQLTGLRFDEINIVGHGDAGYVRLGSRQHSTETLLDVGGLRYHVLQSLRGALNEGATVRLLGCDVGLATASGSGPALLALMANHLGCAVEAPLGPIFPDDFGGEGFKPANARAGFMLKVSPGGQVTVTPRVMTRSEDNPPVSPALNSTEGSGWAARLRGEKLLENAVQVDVAAPRASPYVSPTFLLPWVLILSAGARRASIESIAEAIQWQTLRRDPGYLADVNFSVTFHLAESKQFVATILRDQRLVRTIDQDSRPWVANLDQTQFRSALPELFASP